MKLLLSMILLLPIATALNPECQANPSCKAEGLKGFCCPTDDVESKYLDCCGGIEAACSLYPSCSREGLQDFCCPTADGVMLDCCNEGSQTPPPTLPSTPPGGIGAECSLYPSCNREGLQDFCCPTADGVMLDCCNEGSQTPPPTLSPTPPPLTPTGSRLCSTYTVCVSEELGGNCCPTDDGLLLDCCFGIANEATTPSPIADTNSAATLSPTTVPAPALTPIPTPLPTKAPKTSSKKKKGKGTKAPVRAADVADIIDEEDIIDAEDGTDVEDSAAPSKVVINGVQKAELAQSSGNTKFNLLSTIMVAMLSMGTALI